MKRLDLTSVEVRTLRDMGIFHSHPCIRLRAQAIVRLSQGLTLQRVADEFAVYLNSVDHWRQRWNMDGSAGLYEGYHSGRPPKWNETQQQYRVTWRTNKVGEQAHCCVVLARMGISHQ